MQLVVVAVGSVWQILRVIKIILDFVVVVGLMVTGGIMTTQVMVMMIVVGCVLLW